MSNATSHSPSRPWWQRWWVWVGAIGGVIILLNVLSFPAGRYECIWQGGARPDGLLGEGQLVVDVGMWPATYPLEARLYTTSQGMLIVDSGWTHAHGTFDRDFHAVFPWKGSSYQAFCELP